MHEIQDDWWVPFEDDGSYDIERELYELREWWCRPRQVPTQLELPFDEPKQPRLYFPF